MSARVQTVHGDLFDRIKDYKVVVQQCNCLTTKPLRLSADMVRRFGAYADPYVGRINAPGRTNLARVEDRSEPGTCILLAPPTVTDKPVVACLFAQWSPGSVDSHWTTTYPALGNAPSKIRETRAMREDWFADALSDLNAKLEDKGITHDSVIAFPYAIGCGIAGGDWKAYEKMIEEFALLHQWNIVIYKKD